MNRAHALIPHIRAGMLLLLLLSGCSTFEDITDWMGSSEKKTPLPGERIAVLSDAAHLKPDDSLKGVDVTVPAATANGDWPQAGGGPQGITGNLELSGYSHHDSVKIGDHNGWEQPLYPSPVVAGGLVFAIDAKGYITAHETTDIGKVRWTNKSAVEDNEPDLIGGGLAFEDGRLYVTSGRGKVYAIDAANGKEVWKQVIGLPLRAPPKVHKDKLYVLSIDNQLFALNSLTGTPLWNHRGINENAGFLADISPAATENIVLAPYSSGTLHALDTSSGQDVWNDSLLLSRRNSATAAFSGIGGNPVVDNNIVYATGSSGFFATIDLLSGRRIWDQDVSSLNTPWIAGDFIYLLSSDYELVCMMRADGRVKWTKQLQRYAKEEKRKDPLVWRGPIMAGGQLLIAGTHGQMLVLSPKDGSTITTADIPENITDMPVVAGGKLYVLTQDARLHVLY